MVVGEGRRGEGKGVEGKMGVGATLKGVEGEVGSTLPSPHCFDSRKTHAHPLLLRGSRGAGSRGVED